MCVNVNGKHYLKEDMSIVCNPTTDEQYSGLIGYATIGLLQVFVFPIAITTLIYCAIFNVNVGLDKAAVAFLHDMFQEDSWWFEGFRLLRKVLLTLVARMMTDLSQQLIAASIILTVSQTIVSQYKPYLEKTANRIELAAQTVLIICMVISSLYFSGGDRETSNSKQSAAVAVFALLFATLFTYIVAITWAQCSSVPLQREEGDRQEQAIEGNEGYPRSWISRVSVLFRRKSHSVEDPELQEMGLELPEAPPQPGGLMATGASVLSAAAFEEELQNDVQHNTHAQPVHGVDLK
jgi:hypothetical protein